MPQPSDWNHIPIVRIEDLRDAIHGAGFEATQMAAAPLSGHLAYAERDGVVYNTGLINGQVALRGALSQELLTIGVGLRLGAGSRQWMRETGTGAVGVFHASDDHDAFYTPGTLFATATLSLDRLEEIAANEEIVLNRKVLGGTGIHPRTLSPTTVRQVRQAFELVHCGPAVAPRAGTRPGATLLRAIVTHLGRSPHGRNRRSSTNVHARIVERARAYIIDHLSDPISLDDIVRVSFASQRTLYRAFEEILDDTPQTYVRRLRLHRIRHDLASDAERACTIALVANQWRMSDLGRMAGWYRELFGEQPSDTHTHSKERLRPN
jgi:AraC-like DNA-binding protein